MADAELNRLLNLKVARDRKGMAPNKPLLVLAILDVVEVGAGGVGAQGRGTEPAVSVLFANLHAATGKRD